MKYRKKDNRDIISTLPDEIKSNILSRLPTKYAVRTCVLSRAWESKWKSIHNIDIHIEDSFKLKFVDFMDRVLFSAHNVKCFRFISCDYFPNKHDIRHMKTWLSHVFNRNVEKVIIDSYYDDLLPRSLLTCTSLKELDFNMHCFWNTPINSYFPNLAKLSLSYVNIMNGHSNTDTLMFHFPVLKSLELKNYRWMSVKFVEFYAPALISYLSQEGESDRSDKEIESYTIKIIGATLQNFETCGRYLENFILTGSTISHAALEMVDYLEILDHIVKNGLRIRRLLKESSSLKSLELTGYVAQALARTKSGLPLSSFTELKHLLFLLVIGMV